MLGKMPFKLGLGGSVGFWQQRASGGKESLNKNKKEQKWITCLGIYAFTLLTVLY